MSPAPSPRSAQRRRLAAIAGAFCTVLALIGPAGATTARAPASEVYLVQGVPGGPVDVRIDGEMVREGLASSAIHGPIDLAPGEHTVGFEGDGWSVEAPVEVRSPSEDIVVHLPADPAADPTVTVFANQVAALREGRGRVTVAHTAVVPPADVRADGEVLFANIANGEFVTAEVPQGSYSVDVVPTGGGSPLLGPLDLQVTPAALTRVFAIGQPQGGTMDAIVQVLPVSEREVVRPSSIDAGEAGLVATADDSSGAPSWSLALVVGAFAALLVARVRRRHVRA